MIIAEDQRSRIGRLTLGVSDQPLRLLVEYLPEAAESPTDWLDRTPLMLALRRRHPASAQI